VEDSHLEREEKNYKTLKKEEEIEEFDEILTENTPNIQNNKKFAEDTMNNSSEKKNFLELNASPKMLKKKKADYIYDFVKIRVHLDNHFYILSRFFICRMLTLCKVH